tara:strand:+ start:15307 stop:15621 length:315 start_codon:yes stop_codon:yes gene_type:complete
MEWLDMLKLNIVDDKDVQRAFAKHIRTLRKKAKYSRAALADRSTVPASTIKKFELTGQISFRQLLLLWQSLDDLSRLYEVVSVKEENKDDWQPQTIEDVLKDGF